MGGLSLIHWIIVGAVLLLLFGGRGKISDIMGDVAKGIKSFKKGLSDDDEASAPRTPEPVRAIDHHVAQPSSSSSPPLSQPVSRGEPVAEPRKLG